MRAPPQGTPEYATILAFDVKIDSDARKHADESGVRIFTADIIYHLFDQFTAHMDRLMEQRRQDAKNLAVFPCIVKVIPASSTRLVPMFYLCVDLYLI